MEPIISHHAIVSDQFYNVAVENSASFNLRMKAERKMRQPFLDSQTGVAQNHSNLHIPYRYRCPGRYQGQLYVYPSKRWRKKRRPFPAYDVRVSRANDIETGESGADPFTITLRKNPDMHQISTVENPAARIDTDPIVSVEPLPAEETAKYAYYDEWEQLSDPPDAGEIDDRNSDSSDFEETYIKRKKKKNQKKGSGRKRKTGNTEDKDIDDKEKPYVCDLCGARYKTRPGLSYHLTHFHVNMDEEEVASSPKPISQSHSNDGSPSHGKKPARLSKSSSAPAIASPATPTRTPTPTPKDNSTAKPNQYCDFCLGNMTENKKTGIREELVSCADCGRSGHPTCLQFTANMIISVKKYPWQCIECKSCGLCGTSDNDDQLLFCDDCDRGYHMYCLIPPLTAPPEGSWSCHLCIEEFHGGKKPMEQL